MMQTIQNLNKKEKGFTLIELMIVVAIIGILAAIAIPQFASFKQKAADGVSQSDLGSIASAEEIYYADNSAYLPVAATDATANGAITNLTGSAVSNKTSYVIYAAPTSSYVAYTANSKGAKTYGTDSGGAKQWKTGAVLAAAMPATSTALSNWGTAL